MLLEFLRVFGKNYYKNLVILVFLSMIAGLVELFGILLVIPLINIISNNDIIYQSSTLNFLYTKIAYPNIKLFILLIAGSIGVTFILKNVYVIFAQLYQSKMLIRWRIEICNKIVERYLHAPYTIYLRKNSASMVNTLTSQVHTVLNSYILQLLMMISNIMIVLFLFGLLITEYFIPTVMTIIVSVTLVCLQDMTLKRFSKKLGTEQAEHSNEYTQSLQQSIGALKDTKIFLKEKYFIDVYKVSNTKLSRTLQKIELLNYIPTSLTEITMMLCIITMSCLVLFSPTVFAYKITDIATIAATAFRLTPVLNRLMLAINQVRTSKGATRLLLDEWKDLSSTELEGLNDKSQVHFKKSIALQNVSFTFPNNTKQVIDNISFNIQKGDFIGIVGESGAGKTTIVNMLCGLFTPTKGHMLVDDVKITFDNIRAFRANIGYVAQSIYLMNKSIRENVAFGVKPNEIDHDKVIEALKQAQLYDFCQTLPEGIETIISENGKNLSGGQQQRINIARALYKNPQILILDEATSSLDVKTESQLTAIFNQLYKTRKITVVFISHRLSSLKFCNRIISVAKGKITEFNSVKEFQNSQR